MSGIATFTYRVVRKLEGLNTQVLDTRKTTPVNRVVEKMAVRIGGGHNHRFGLYDMIMIKDNHIDFAGGIENAIQATQDYLKKTGKDLKIEIEVRNFQELRTVMETGGVHRIMLDNFDPDDLRPLRFCQARWKQQTGCRHHRDDRCFTVCIRVLYQYVF